MKIDEREEEQGVVLSLAGRLDGAGAPLLETRVSDVARRGGRPVVLDCSLMSYVSSAGLRGILISARNCVRAGGNLAIAALRPECRAVMEASGLLTVLDCRPTVEAALDALDRRAAPGGYGQTAAEGQGRIELMERREGPAVVVAVDGALDGAGGSCLEEQVLTIAGRGDNRLVLDCAEMSYVNSSGLRALLLCAKECRQRGGKLVIACLRDECRSVLEMSGFLSIIEYRETTGAALAALAADR